MTRGLTLSKPPKHDVYVTSHREKTVSSCSGAVSPLFVSQQFEPTASKSQVSMRLLLKNQRRSMRLSHLRNSMPVRLTSSR